MSVSSVLGFCKYALMLNFKWSPSVFYGILGNANVLLMPTLFADGRRFFKASMYVPDLFKALPDLRKDIWLIGSPGTMDSPLAALGSNFSFSAVVFRGGLDSVDLQAFNFMLTHEISHIYHSDGAVASSLAAAAALITALALPPIAATSIPMLFLPLAVSQTVYTVAMRYFEGRADRFACTHANDEQLKGGIRALKAQIAIGKELHEKHSWTFSKGGDVILDFSHPKYTDRLRSLEKEAEKRGISTDEPSEELMSYWRESVRQHL